MKLYRELAPWFHLLTAPKDYAEEAAAYVRLFHEYAAPPVESLLELGAGGGNNASHYKAHFRSVTLTDLSEGMLAVSRTINPECEHVQGDMRSLRLDRQFDAVLVHDAVAYMLSEDDLRRTIATAFAHTAPGGVALFVPDAVRETFEPATRHGGHDGDGRALRYLTWTRDPDASDTTYLVDFALLLDQVGHRVQVYHEQHINGLFGREEWLRYLREAGFMPTSLSEWLSGARLEMFVAKRQTGVEGTLQP
jgi:trans-aconitate methyltransferase